MKPNIGYIITEEKAHGQEKKLVLWIRWLLSSTVFKIQKKCICSRGPAFHRIAPTYGTDGRKLPEVQATMCGMTVTSRKRTPMRRRGCDYTIFKTNLQPFVLSAHYNDEGV